MTGLHRVAIAVAVLSLLLAAGTQAADWEVWPDPTTNPPDDQQVILPVMPTGESIYVGTETDSSWVIVDVHQTREKDGKVYKALQASRDTNHEVEVPVGMYLAGGNSAFFYPPGSGVDCMAMLSAYRLVTMEVDGEVIPIDMTYLQPFQLDMSKYGGQGTMEGAAWNVWLKFTTTGVHTWKLVFRQVEDFFFLENYETSGLTDPSPEFERRRVYVTEQVGDPVDGDMVYSYRLTVVADPTVVEACSWARVKAALPSPE